MLVPEPVARTRNPLIQVNDSEALLGQSGAMPREGLSSQYYRDQAKRIRALAEASSLPDMKEQLLTIADQFDRLAEQYDKGLLR